MKYPKSGILLTKKRYLCRKDKENAMKKFLFVLLTLGIVFAFTACGSDDDPEPIVPEDLTLKDNSPLVATYIGECRIEVTDIVKPAKLYDDAKVKLERTNDANVLILNTDQFGAVLDGKLTGFKNTQERDAYTFSMGGFSLKNFTGESIPSYIVDWFGSNYSEITNINITLDATSAKYTIFTKTLNFVYTGSLEIQGRANETPRTDKYKIKYTYSVVKQ